MKEKVLIKIVGKQQYGDEKDNVEMITFGTFSENENSYLLEYDEVQQESDQPVRVVITIMKDETGASISRHNQDESFSVMEIRQGTRTICDYATPYGIVSMGVTGKKVESSVEEKSAQFIYKYNIDSDGQLCSENSVKIVCKDAK